MAAGGEAATSGSEVARSAFVRPQAPDAEEAILWEGRPNTSISRIFSFGVFIVLLTLLSWLAVELILPHFRGSVFAGNPEPSALPLILVMLLGMVVIMVLPTWLRTSAKGRAVYMLTNRRALIWLGRNIVGEAVLFGADMETRGDSVSFDAPNLYLDWRLKNEGPDRVTFADIADVDKVAELAEQHGAFWTNRSPKDDTKDIPR